MSQPYMRRPPELRSELPARSRCYSMWQSQHVLSIGMIDIVHEVPVYMQGDGSRALCMSPLLFVEKSRRQKIIHLIHEELRDASGSQGSNPSTAQRSSARMFPHFVPGDLTRSFPRYISSSKYRTTNGRLNDDH